MTPEQFKKKLENMTLEVEKYANDKAPRILGKTARDFFSDSFQKEGFVNNGLHKWAEVNRRTGGTINSKGKFQKNNAKGADRTRKILTGRTGALGRSIQYRVAKGEVSVFSNLPYAAAHNEGTGNAGRSRNVTIPQRQFIGESSELDALIISEINRKLNTLK